MKKKERILVAMSGGIDSTIAALMLHKQGYEIVGITMKTWDYAEGSNSKKETGCCSLDSINDARNVAVDMGFHHYIIDIREEFGDFVINDFISEYMAGRTPNPCILCNTHIKWKALLKRADALDCTYIATGHYANIGAHGDRKFVYNSKDQHKDQSYVLWGLSQECLGRTIFPLGNYLKSEIRKKAIDEGYESLAKKSESYEICFVPENNYREFLKREIPNLEEQVKGGNFVDKNGNIIGHHHGYPFYTIGQRKLGQGFGKPMYVCEIKAETNTVVLDTVEGLMRNKMTVGNLNCMKYKQFPENKELLVKVRYNDPGTLATIKNKESKIEIEFMANVKGVAPGQSAVIYENDHVIGGGIIMNAEMNVN